jgi:RNA polymerase sigma-70 factor (ECF subfamily)
MNSIQSQVNLPGAEEGALDEKAQAELFYRYAPSLFAYLRQHTSSREDAEDLLHEIFLAALKWEPFHQLDASAQEKWLWRVARNKVADAHRRSVRKPSLALDSIVDLLYAGEEQSPEYILMRREEYARLRAALEQLPAIQQEALRLRFANELSCAEVAKALGKREGALRSMLSRAISRLRAIYTGKKEV